MPYDSRQGNRVSRGSPYPDLSYGRYRYTFEESARHAEQEVAALLARREAEQRALALFRSYLADTYPNDFPPTAPDLDARSAPLDALIAAEPSFAPQAESPSFLRRAAGLGLRGAAWSEALASPPASAWLMRKARDVERPLPQASPQGLSPQDRERLRLELMRRMGTESGEPSEQGTAWDALGPLSFIGGLMFLLSKA